MTVDLVEAEVLFSFQAGAVDIPAGGIVGGRPTVVVVLDTPSETDDGRVVDTTVGSGVELMLVPCSVVGGEVVAGPTDVSSTAEFTANKGQIFLCE